MLLIQNVATSRRRQTTPGRTLVPDRMTGQQRPFGVDGAVKYGEEVCTRPLGRIAKAQMASLSSFGSRGKRWKVFGSIWGGGGVGELTT